MPYNNSAIPPPEDITGSAALPLARVKKILHLDEDIQQVSNNATFVITVATEMFVRHLAEQANIVAKTEAKPRRNIQYKDIANAVARHDNLEFLSDIIPRTTTFGEWKSKKAKDTALALARKTKPLPVSQTTIDGNRPTSSHLVDASAEDTMDEDGPSVEETAELAILPGRETNGEGRIVTNGGLVFEHYEPKGGQKAAEGGDVEMG